MKRLIIFPYKMGSESAKLLANELGAKRVYSDGRYKYKSNDVILNWGNSNVPRWATPNTHWINTPEQVALASNKISTLHQLTLSTIPLCEVGGAPLEFTMERPTAEQWLSEGAIVYCRTTVCGSGGSGIVVATSLDEIVNAPLYTKGVANDKEYRVHVFNGKVIDFARKGLRRTEDEADRPSYLVRNHTKGWVFIREGVELPEVVKETAIKAIESLGLTFGGVDICTIKGSSDTQACVFEVNTACGIAGTGVLRYVTAIKEYMEEIA